MRLVATSIVALEVFFLKLKLFTLTGRAGGFCHAEATAKESQRGSTVTLFCLVLGLGGARSWCGKNPTFLPYIRKNVGSRKLKVDIFCAYEKKCRISGRDLEQLPQIYWKDPNYTFFAIYAKMYISRMPDYTFFSNIWKNV